jgi:hypothetical protein
LGEYEVEFSRYGGNPEKGEGRQQPHHNINAKFKKYKGGRKRHTMAAPSSPKVFK